MFFHRVDRSLNLSLTIPQYSQELFALTDRNRAYLKQWLPWLDTIGTVADTESFIHSQLHLFAQGKALHTTIFQQSWIAGVVGYNQIDQANGIGVIGYWLGQAFQGQGIMRRCVGDLIDLGLQYYRLNRIEIRCAEGNRKSRAIPEHLGFRQEGISPQVERLSDTRVDQVVYALLKQDAR